MYSDASLTAANIAEVMELVAAVDMTKIWWQMMGGKPSLSSVTKEKTQTLVDLYLNFNASPSWRHITDVLYSCGQMDEARKAKSFYRQYGKLQ